jgi:microcystin-dependent protein
MSQPFIAQITIFGGNFAPRGWAFCNGQIIAISQNTALFALLGTNYGGNGETTFALPDLRDRAPMGSGSGAGLTQRFLGESNGSASVSLRATEMPAHNHNVLADTATGTSADPTNNTWAGVGGRGRPTVYAPSAGTTMSAQAIANAGLGVPHNNMSPFLGLSFIIALEGIFPSRN